MLQRTSVSSVRRLAAISGSAAFLAPPIVILPARGRLPRMRILSIGFPGSADGRLSGLKPSAVGEDNRMLTVKCGEIRQNVEFDSAPFNRQRSALVVGRGLILADAGLLLALAQIVAQRRGEPFLPARRFTLAVLAELRLLRRP